MARGASWACAAMVGLFSVTTAGCAVAEAEPVDVDLRGEQGVLVFEVSMPRVVEGENELELRLLDAATRAAVADAVVEVDAIHVEMGHGLDVPPSIDRAADGTYLVHDLTLPMPGRWTIELRAEGELADSSSFDVVVR
jgi:hypothetical protein